MHVMREAYSFWARVFTALGAVNTHHNYIIMPRNVIDDTYLGKLVNLVEEHPALYMTLH